MLTGDNARTAKAFTCLGLRVVGHAVAAKDAPDGHLVILDKEKAPKVEGQFGHDASGGLGDEESAAGLVDAVLGCPIELVALLVVVPVWERACCFQAVADEVA